MAPMRETAFPKHEEASKNNSEIVIGVRFVFIGSPVGI